MKLEAKKVNSIFISCLFEDGEPTDNHILAEGITKKVGFNPKKLNKYKGDIIKLLNELPETFKAKGGGGMSFLNACNDKNDIQWGEHRNMEELFLLGIAINKVKCLMPREMWNILPGGMPYYQITE